MKKAEYYARELNIICFGICLLIVATYWIQQLSPELYAFLQVIIEGFSNGYYLKGVDPANPIDYVNKLL